VLVAAARPASGLADWQTLQHVYDHISGSGSVGWTALARAQLVGRRSAKAPRRVARTSSRLTRQAAPRGPSRRGHRCLFTILLDTSGTFAPIGAKVFDGKVG